MSNHLGNVLAVVSDKKIGVSSGGSLNDYYNPDIVSANDYYPFGMLAKVAISGTGSHYKFGFNGQEFDWEVKAWQNQYDYGMRVYDPRIGKFLSVDPLANKFPYWSPYHFSANSPIKNTDLDGAEPKPAITGTQEGQTQTTSERKIYPRGNALLEKKWYWHAGGLVDNHGKKTTANWYTSGDYAKLLSNTQAAGALGRKLGLYSHMAENMNAGGDEELARFAGSGLNEAAAGHLAAAAQIDAKRDNDFVSGRTYPSAFNVEDAFAVIMIAKQGLRVLTNIALKKLAASETATIIYSKIALGVSEHLEDFAKAVGGQTWRAWGTKDFQTQFLDVINDAKSQIHFNLTGPDGKMLNVWQSVGEGARGYGASKATNWELYQIYSNPAALERTIFYFNGNVVPNPFK